MVTPIELSSRELPKHIAVSWRDAASGRWCEVEVAGEFLDLVIFRDVKPLSAPLMPIPKLADIYEVPQAFEDVWGVVVRMKDVEKAVYNYKRRRGGFEGFSRIER